LLRCLESHANKQRKYIVPLMSCSIDFYVRVFVRVYTSPMNVKRSASKQSYFYVCSGCESFHFQAVGQRFEEGNKKKYTPGVGPAAPPRCEECGRAFHMGGPIWTEPMHDPAFVGKLLEYIKKSTQKTFATHTRMLGMVTVIAEV
jgi:tRNA (guanine26-N2/guanine27-N2)-dimethyltransferase